MRQPGNREIASKTKRPLFTIATAGEAAAAHYLQSKGMEIIARNWRSGKFAEIDIVARDKQLVVFVEVKTRKYEPDFGIPTTGLESVNWYKQRKLLIAGAAFLARHKMSPVCRYDVVAVQYQEEELELFLTNPTEAGVSITHVDSAFSPF